jgi:hypothetical protein
MINVTVSNCLEVVDYTGTNLVSLNINSFSKSKKQDGCYRMKVKRWLREVRQG